MLGGPDPSAFFVSLMQLDQKTQLSFVKFLGKYATLSKDLQNPLALKATDKLALAGKLDDLIADLEGAIGVSKISNIPTDLDAQLVDRCAGKDYHDVVTNAFALLEDKIRYKLGVGRAQFGEGLIDLAFNPNKEDWCCDKHPLRKKEYTCSSRKLFLSSGIHPLTHWMLMREEMRL